MSSSSPRRLLFLLLVVSLAFPSHAFAASWDFGTLLARAGGFFSALWAPAGSAKTQKKSEGRVIGEVGCEVLPGGLCGT